MPSEAELWKTLLCSLNRQWRTLLCKIDQHFVAPGVGKSLLFHSRRQRLAWQPAACGGRQRQIYLTSPNSHHHLPLPHFVLKGTVVSVRTEEKERFLRFFNLIWQCSVHVRDKCVQLPIHSLVFPGENPDGSELFRKVAAHQIEHHKQPLRGNFEKEVGTSKLRLVLLWASNNLYVRIWMMLLRFDFKSRCCSGTELGNPCLNIWYSILNLLLKPISFPVICPLSLSSLRILNILIGIYILWSMQSLLFQLGCSRWPII